MSETYAIVPEHLIECPVHGVVPATGAIRDENGKLTCLRCRPDLGKLVKREK